MTVALKIRKTDFAQARRFSRREYHHSRFSESLALNCIKAPLNGFPCVFFGDGIAAVTPFAPILDLTPH